MRESDDQGEAELLIICLRLKGALDDNLEFDIHGNVWKRISKPGFHHKFAGTSGQRFQKADLIHCDLHAHFLGLFQTSKRSSSTVTRFHVFIFFT